MGLSALSLSRHGCYRRNLRGPSQASRRASSTVSGPLLGLWSPPSCSGSAGLERGAFSPILQPGMAQQSLEGLMIDAPELSEACRESMSSGIFGAIDSIESTAPVSPPRSLPRCSLPKVPDIYSADIYSGLGGERPGSYRPPGELQLPQSLLIASRPAYRCRCRISLVQQERMLHVHIEL